MQINCSSMGRAVLPKTGLILSVGLVLFVVGTAVVTGLQGRIVLYVATSGDDNSDCLSLPTACFTIQAAVDKANATDTILIATGTYTQHTTIDKSLTVMGADKESTVINGNASGRVFTVTQSSTVTISALTITNGRATEGGGVYNDGILTLNDCYIHNNSAIGIDGLSNLPNSDGGDGRGGGIYNGGTLILTSCFNFENMAKGGDAENGRAGEGQGGSIFSSGTLTVNSSTISNSIAAGGEASGIEGIGLGGGIFSSGTVSLDNSQIVSNTASSGGGLYSSPFLAGYNTIELINSDFSHNAVTADGGAVRDSCSNTLHCTVVLDHSTVKENSANRGGGIYTSGASAGSTSVVTITHSTIHSNVASFQGGGLFTVNQVGGTKTTTLVNSTNSSNSAGNQAGAIYVNTSFDSSNLVQLINTTVISNSAPTAGGIYATAGGSGSSMVTFKNTIVANDLSSQNCFRGNGGTTVSNGHNLENGNSCDFNSAGDMTNTAPQSGELADNGGATWTHALLPGSPAVDAGDDLACLAAPVAAVDQRDGARPLDGDNDGSAICDIGAYELDGGVVTSTPSPTNTATATPTVTASATPTSTSTATATNIATATMTASPAPTSTPTATATNMMTVSPTNTATATPTMMPSLTNTPTTTPTSPPKVIHWLYLPLVEG